MSNEESYPNEPRSSHHFKLISEGGSCRHGSPGPLSCNDSLWSVRDCTTDSHKDIWRRSQEGCTGIASADQFKFTLSLEYAPELDQGIIPDSLRREFKEKGVALAKTAQLTVLHTGKVWLITDKEHRYSVRMLPTNLFVYTQGS